MEASDESAFKRLLNQRSLRFWLTVTLVSVFAYNLYWLIDGFIGSGRYIGAGMVANLFSAIYHLQLPPIWVSAHASAALGLVIRAAGLSLVLFALYLAFGRGKPSPFLKNAVSAGLLLEAVYFISLLLSVFMEYSFGMYLVAWMYLLQILLVAPLFIFLGVKISRSQSVFDAAFGRVLGLAFVGYVTAMWVNNVPHWIVISEYFTQTPIPSGDALIGFANSVVWLSLALGFAVAACWSVHKTSVPTTLRLLGLSLATIGGYFITYLCYSYFTHSLSLALLVEIWAVPLAGLGITIFRAASHSD